MLIKYNIRQANLYVRDNGFMSTKKQDYIRYLSEDRIDDFKSVSGLAKLLTLIKNDKEQRFQLEIRQNYVTVYYNGGKLSNIKKGRDGNYTTDFNINYCKNQGKDSANLTQIEEIGKHDIQAFVDNIGIYTAEMDAWFTRHPKAERANQQIICKKFRQQNDVLNLLDIEFVLQSARFDMLGVDNNGTIKLIELKVGNKALSSAQDSRLNKPKCGINKHYLDFLHIAKSKELANAVVCSAANIINVRKKLGLATFDEKLNCNTDSIQFEIWLADYSTKGTILAREIQMIEQNGGNTDIIKINPPFLTEIKKNYK